MTTLCLARGSGVSCWNMSWPNVILPRNTQHSYRDAVSLLIPFVAKARKKPVERLDVIDVSADLVRHFLADIETSRHCGIATRNQRLAAIRAFAGFVGEHSPGPH